MVMKSPTSVDQDGGGPDERPLVLRGSWDPQIGAVVLTGEASGPAGVVDVEPVAGVVVSFDATTLAPCELLIEDKEDGDLGRLDLGVAGVCERLLGAKGFERLRKGLGNHRTVVDVSLSGERELWVGLARLARAAAVQVTDPVSPASPLWEAEEALLAHEAGLESLARRHAGRAVERLAGFVSRAPDALGDTRVREALEVVSGLVGPAAPEASAALVDALAGKLLDPGQLEPRAERAPWPAGQGGAPALVLDATLLPERTFLFGADPSQDAVIEEAEGSLSVWIRLHPWARRSVVESCRLRLVDRRRHEVLAEQPLTRVGSLAHASLALEPAPFGEMDLEIVEDGHVPVAGTSLARRRAALRYGDAALRAERRPTPLHPTWSASDWASEAARLWRESAAAWDDAGEEERARQAERRGREAGETDTGGDGRSAAFLAEVFVPLQGGSDRPSTPAPGAARQSEREAPGVGGRDDVVDPEHEASVVAFRQELEQAWWLVPVGVELEGPWDVRVEEGLVGAGFRSGEAEPSVTAPVRGSVRVVASAVEVDLGRDFAGAGVELRPVGSGSALGTARLDEAGRGRLSLPKGAPRRPLRLTAIRGKDAV